jgi:hypothetical protein
MYALLFFIFIIRLNKFILCFIVKGFHGKSRNKIA